jgi:L-amino acid N-acyltransferase YncA/ADP-ribose pyrophosphatase YjhB (NUDIX family)
VVIRPATNADAESIWEIFSVVVAGRDSYAFHPKTARAEGVGYWFGKDVTSAVAEDEGRVVGIYKLIPNRPGLGSHVANASFMVHPHVAGRGVGHALGDACLREARRQGYDAMQFNFVVSTNTRAVALWQRLGFAIVGTIPEAFQHGRLGLVDAYVMHRFLEDIVLTFAEPDASRGPGPCAYLVMADDQRRIAVLESAAGVRLPGGTANSSESEREAALRRTWEQCAIEAVVDRRLGRANHDLPSGEAVVSSTFFLARAEGTAVSAPQHPTRWLSPEEAERAVSYQSHAWAIACWRRLHV